MIDDQKTFVMQACKDRDIKFIRLWFTDILGSLKSFAITVEELEQAMDEGQGFDGSSIEGFARVDESDMVAMPDPATFQVLPWRPRERGVARMFCDIQMPDGDAVRGRPAVRAEAPAEAGSGSRLHVLRRAGAGVLLLQDVGRRRRGWTRAATST